MQKTCLRVFSDEADIVLGDFAGFVMRVYAVCRKVSQHHVQPLPDFP